MGKQFLPIGIQTFRDIRGVDNNFIYVDKTESIWSLVEANKGFYFLSRPRRFGKSLMLDTLAELFEGNRSLFEGLYIYDKWNWDKSFPVVRIDFSTGDYSSLDSVKGRITEILRRESLKFGIDFDSLVSQDIGTLFERIVYALYQKYSQPVVILIDEYDKPILDNLGSPDIAKEIRNTLRTLYSVLKSSDRYIRFGMLTGVSKFSKMTLFSGANNLYDITVDTSYSTLVGYTQSELEYYFSEYLIGVDLDKVQQWYNGYNYLGSSIYNPYDILLFFSKGCLFKNYWWETGNPQFLIDQIQKGDYHLPNLETATVSLETLNRFDIEDIDLVALLWQTGYLTFDKEIELIPDIIDYKMKVPNLEVQISLNALFYEVLTDDRNREEKRGNVVRALLESEDNRFESELRSLFASIPYHNYTKNRIANYEGYYSSVIFTFLSSLGFNVIVEDATNVGRVDMTIIGVDTIYILEFKVDASAEDAIFQIEQRRYYEKYQSENKRIALIGINFSSIERNIEKLEWRELINGNKIDS